MSYGIACNTIASFSRSDAGRCLFDSAFSRLLARIFAAAFID